MICHLLITFANNLGPDQDWHNVSPHLDSDFYEKVNFGKKAADTTKSMKNNQATGDTKIVVVKSA